MKTFKILSVILLLLFVACKEQNKSSNSTTPEDSSIADSTTVQKTYAEISIAQGGEWVDGPRDHKEYNGTTSFKNINELKVPDNHTDHSWYIRYEGPGWESNKVGYRLYLDWRNAIDIFGKKVDTMVLSKVGQDGFDSYHEPEPWGQDILKVGNGLGIGSIGRLVDNKVLHFKEVDSTFASVKNTNEKSSVNVKYFAWKTGEDKIDLESTRSIAPNKRYTKHTFRSSKEISGICTGIVDHGVEYLTKESENKKWAYIATYGEQTLVPDDLGMAVLYEVETISNVIDGEFDYLLEFKPTTSPVSFYFLGAWEQEMNGIKTREEFLMYLDDLLAELNSNNKL